MLRKDYTEDGKTLVLRKKNFPMYLTLTVLR